MYLKKIVATGFKSFADNTIIDLNNNIAGIVGPNGSGKSNVVDAIRWVLGEQSVKSLRGDLNMTDVIFSGSKSRNPMNVATVTLIFDNSDNYLNIAYDEVAIKRRLYKDGTNEFFINNEKCRLKDVSDLLMDSGIAKESFNIISQGKIDEILLSKPESRRTIFEEAAGVLKYKKRKEEALKKLDKTHNNMSRINDIISELEVQIEPLREQKIKAEEYLSLEDKYKKLDISLIVNDISNINYRYQENKNNVEALKEEILKLSTSNNTNETEIISLKNKISNCEKEIKDKQNLLFDIVSKIENLNAKKQIILERKGFEVNDVALHNSIINLKEEELKIKNDISSCKNKIKVKDDELSNINSELSKLEDELEKLKNDKSNSIFKLNDIVKKSNILNTKIDTLKESIEHNSSLPYSVKSIIENPKLSGIHNIIASLIETEKKYSLAVSVALGGNANNVVVDNENSAKEAIKYLKDNNIGRVTFFPLNIIKEKYVDGDTLNILSKQKGYINILSSVVKNDSKYDNIIKNQLGNIILVDNIDNATTISKNISHKYKIVTLDGEVLHVGGSLTGGSIKVRNSIMDKYELENNIRLLKEIEVKQKDIENYINKLDNDIKALEDKLYLKNKDKLSIQEYINIKNSDISNLVLKLDEITDSITSLNNKLNNTIDKQEEEILNEYYGKVEEKEKISTELELLNNNKIRLNQELETSEYEVKKENSMYNEKNNLLHKLEIEINRDDVKLDNLLNNLSETYSMTYEHALSIYKLDMDVNLARETVATLKRKIKELGPINLMAPEEYAKVSERYEFLIHQQEDLNNAENTLLEIIDEMDSVMKEEFIKTFKVIQDNFSTTFKELFKGGTAKLKLTDPNNILETGVEIEACPPGKTLKSISLLSGGEKTFTAISLLFAILKSRPVPFCVLDEVEAALDEVNVEAFGEYLHKLKEKTQFIVITHKKKTMEFVDILYGITMQESGVSKLVSVKLEEIK